ncbi:hypothetical protein EYF80_066101 [Liparis tanakae]|uniref:Uncharacterized protein n=1 Tax=Liparis tanakae TaxID=230148 RepID=A0A4Z2E4U8_9TELE|nr:hypothetical protein EYF80_066101 [Liparis tanakae]
MVFRSGQRVGQQEGRHHM